MERITPEILQQLKESFFEHYPFTKLGLELDEIRLSKQAEQALIYQWLYGRDLSYHSFERKTVSIFSKTYHPILAFAQVVTKTLDWQDVYGKYLSLSDIIDISSGNNNEYSEIKQVVVNRCVTKRGSHGGYYFIYINNVNNERKDEILTDAIRFWLGRADSVVIYAESEDDFINDFPVASKLVFDNSFLVMNLDSKKCEPPIDLPNPFEKNNLSIH